MTPSAAEVALVLSNPALAEALRVVPGPGWWVYRSGIHPNLTDACCPTLHNLARETWLPADASAILAEAARRVPDAGGTLMQDGDGWGAGLGTGEWVDAPTAREAALRLLLAVLS